MSFHAENIIALLSFMDFKDFFSVTFQYSMQETPAESKNCMFWLVAPCSTILQGLQNEDKKEKTGKRKRHRQSAGYIYT